MTPHNDSWPWFQSTMPAASSPSEFDFNASGLDYFGLPLVSEDQPESSVPGSEHTTPVVDLIASPDIDFVGDDGLLDAQSLSFAKFPHVFGFAASPLAASTDCLPSSAALLGDSVPQQPLLVLPMDYTSNYASPCFSPLDDFESPLFSEEELARLSTTLSDLPISMSANVPNMMFGTLANMDTGGQMPMEAVAPSMAYQHAALQPPQIPQMSLPPPPLPAHASEILPMPAAAPSPATFAAPSVSYSPRTYDGDHSDASASAAASASGAASASSATRYPCPLCASAFASPALMRKHKKRHNKEYVCDVCAKQCGAQKERDRHMWVHHADLARLQGIPPVAEACPEPGCSYTGRKDNVQRHYKTKHAP